MPAPLRATRLALKTILLTGRGGSEREATAYPVQLADEPLRWAVPLQNDDAALLLRLGWLDVARLFGSGVAVQPELGAEAECHANSVALTRSDPDRFHCVLGLAGKPVGTTLFVTCHSWCADSQARVVDPTIPAGEDPAISTPTRTPPPTGGGSRNGVERNDEGSSGRFVQGTAV